MLAPDQLRQQVEALAAHPHADLVLGRTRYWSSWSGGHDRSSDIEVPPDRVVPPPTLFPHLVTDGGRFFCTCSFMVRRSLVDRVGGFVDEFRGLYEDQAFFAKATIHAPILLSSAVWGWYRQHPGSASATGDLVAARAAFLAWLDGYLREEGMRDGRLGRVLDEIGARRGPELLVRSARWLARRTLPDATRRSLRRRWDRRHQPRLGRVDFGDLRRVTPVSEVFGEPRGTPIDRYYIEAFLARHATDIRGRVLEIGEDTYTKRFGGGRVTSIDVLHVFEGNPQATIVADLSRADELAGDAFDCIVFTQTLQLIYDARSTLGTLHRLLAPGGVLLATFPGITQIDEDEWGRPHWYWNFTTLSARRLFGEVFDVDAVEVEPAGNVLAATAFLHGLAVAELEPHELDARDPHYEVVITVRARKAGAADR